MTNLYSQRGLTARFRPLLLGALCVGAASAAQAQTLPYTVNTTLTRSGTYTDLGTGANTTVITTANTDDAESTAQTIGFNFNFNGTSFSQFVLNTNGLIKLGGTGLTGAAFVPYAQENVGGPVASTDNNLIMPFNVDLTAGSAGTEYRMALSGTGTSHVLTIQWKNVKDKPSPASSTSATPVATQYANISFQVKLYETSNRIEFVYGQATAGAVAGDDFKRVNVGIKGSGSATGQVILGTKASTQVWSQTTFLNTAYTANNHNVRGTVLPDAGRTYIFNVPVPIDVATQVIYGYGKIAPPAMPVVIRASVANTGTSALSNISVTLTVTGANSPPAATRTVASLAVGASSVVVFPAITLSSPGNNTLTVTSTVANDGNSTNDTQTDLMVTNPTTTSYITAGQGPVSAFGFQAGATDAYFGAKFSFPQATSIQSVNAFFFNEPAAVGSTAYGVVTDPTTGALLARSADFVVTTASLNQLHTFQLTSPPNIAAGTDVIVGMATVAAPGAVQFFLMGVQSENPNRPGAFFTGSATTAAAPTAALNTPTTNIYKYMLEVNTGAPITCLTPSNVAITNATQTTASVTFTGPPNGTSYQVVYVPAGTTPGPNSPSVTGTSSPIALTGLTAGTNYDVYVRTTCQAPDMSTLAGPTAFSTPCAPPIITTYPYQQNFDVISPGQTLPCGITVTDNNGDGSTWRARNSVPAGLTSAVITRNASPFAMVYETNQDGFTAADDWFYLPAMRFVANGRYRLSFYYRRGINNLEEALEVKYGATTTSAAQTNLLWSNTNITSATYVLADNASTPAVTDITNATGLNYIGFHCISAADKQYLAVDDVNITSVLATSDALARAVNIYPNPSATGRFNLDVNGANAGAGLQVEVSNMLGQHVYTGTARDNFRNSLDLSQLPSGIYSLKVRNGGEYFQQQLSIVK